MSDINEVRERLEEVAAVCERDQWQRAAVDIRALLADHARLQQPPTIDLEQFREPVLAFKREVIEKERGRRDGSPIRGSDWYRDKCQKIERLLDLIDGLTAAGSAGMGSAKCATCGTTIRPHLMTGTTCACASRTT